MLRQENEPQGIEGLVQKMQGCGPKHLYRFTAEACQIGIRKAPPMCLDALEHVLQKRHAGWCYQGQIQALP